MHHSTTKICLFCQERVEEGKFLSLASHCWRQWRNYFYILFLTKTCTSTAALGNFVFCENSFCSAPLLNDKIKNLLRAFFNLGYFSSLNKKTQIFQEHNCLLIFSISGAFLVRYFPICWSLCNFFTFGAFYSWISSDFEPHKVKIHKFINMLNGE